MQFLYRLFNAAEDGKLKANEIVNMMNSFQPNTKGYNECMVVANALWNSQMGKAGIRIDYISMPYFTMILRKSYIMQTIIRTLSIQ